MIRRLMRFFGKGKVYSNYFSSRELNLYKRREKRITGLREATRINGPKNYTGKQVQKNKN
jgi:hypothetical protein